MSDLGVAVDIPVVCIVAVVAGVVVVMLCLPPCRRQTQSDDNHRYEDNGGGIERGSGSIRSDTSDHTYENPPLPQKSNGHHGNNNRTPEVTDQYAPLQGQSLPHYYQDLREKTGSSRLGREGGTLPGEDSHYDELMAWTEDSNSDYYFKLDPGSSRGNTARSDTERLESSQSDPDCPYDKVAIGNQRVTTDESRSTQNDTLESADSSINPYYFKVEMNANEADGQPTASAPGVERNRAGSDAANANASRASGSGNVGSTEDHSQPHVDPESDEDNGGVTTLKNASSYDKLDRAVLRYPPENHRGSASYNKLSPRQESESSRNASSTDPRPNGTYLKIKASGDSKGTGQLGKDGELHYGRLEKVTEQDIRRNFEVSADETYSNYSRLDRGSEPDIRFHLEATGGNTLSVALMANDLNPSADDNDDDDAIPVEL